MPGAFEIFRTAYQDNKNAGIFVGEGQKIDVHGKIVYHKKPDEIINLESLYHWLEGGDFMQPSCMFTRETWLKCGPLNEDIHISLDVDLWLRIARAGIEFVSVNELISVALNHPNAKTQAFKNLMLVDCALTIAGHGGVHAVRKPLTDMSHRLSWLQENYEILVKHPLLKFARPIIKRIGKQGSYWNSKIPPWVYGE